MGNVKRIKIDMSSNKLPEIVPSDLFNIKANILNSQLNNIQQVSQKIMNTMGEEERLKEEREEENRANLRSTAENLEQVNEKLEKQIKLKDEDLHNQRELIQMLRQQIDGISRTLSDLFIIEENNQEMQEEANELARKIYATMIQNNKVDWKSLLKEKGPDVLLTAIPIIFQLAKVI